jgi:NADPH:quinone reductase-like Zn-dependent oxidoreductase
MKAITYSEFGDESVLTLSQDHPDPVPGEGELLVRVKAVSVNPVDWKVVAGYARDSLPTVFPAIPGWDLAGVVEALGPGAAGSASGTAGSTSAVAAGFTPGDEVNGYARKPEAHGGTFAELVVVEPWMIVRKARGDTFEQSAGLPLAGLTAYQCLAAIGLGPGDTVLIHAAAGGVGSLGVQIARALGARVIGTASERNHDFLRRLGAEPVVYGPGLANRVRALAPEGVDGAVDLIGGEAVEVSRHLLKDGTRIASVLDPAIAESGGHYVLAHADTEQLAQLNRWVDEGRLAVPIDRILPLSATAEAFQLSKTGRTRGKIILSIR